MSRAIEPEVLPPDDEPEDEPRRTIRPQSPRISDRIMDMVSNSGLGDLANVDVGKMAKAAILAGAGYAAYKIFNKKSMAKMAPTITRVKSGAPYILGAAAAGIINYTLVPRKYRKIGIVAPLALGAVGAYRFMKKTPEQIMFAAVRNALENPGNIPDADIIVAKTSFMEKDNSYIIATKITSGPERTAAMKVFGARVVNGKVAGDVTDWTMGVAEPVKIKAGSTFSTKIAGDSLKKLVNGLGEYRIRVFFYVPESIVMPFYAAPMIILALVDGKIAEKRIS